MSLLIQKQPTHGLLRTVASCPELVKSSVLQSLEYHRCFLESLLAVMVPICLIFGILFDSAAAIVASNTTSQTS